jgi:hypothetical protein
VQQALVAVAVVVADAVEPQLAMLAAVVVQVSWVLVATAQPELPTVAAAAAAVVEQQVPQMHQVQAAVVFTAVVAVVVQIVQVLVP